MSDIKKIITNDYLSSVKIYNRALSDEEVLYNYNSMKKRFGHT